MAAWHQKSEENGGNRRRRAVFSLQNCRHPEYIWYPPARSIEDDGTRGSETAGGAMGMAGGRTGKKARGVAAGAGADRITALPAELRARIALLPYRQAIRLSALSRPWRRVHHHTPVVELNLSDFLYRSDILVKDDALAGMEAALLRRALDESGGCKVETLRLTCGIYDSCIWRHANSIIALADAREIRIVHDGRGRWADDACALDLPPAARALEVVMFSYYLSPAVAGRARRRLPEGAIPRLRGAPRMAAPPVPGRPDPQRRRRPCAVPGGRRRSPRLPFLDRKMPRHPPAAPAMLDTDFRTNDALRQLSVFGDASVTVDAPELEELEVSCRTAWRLKAAEYRSFAQRSPRLRRLCWRNQLARRVDIRVGRPCSVAEGTIVFTSSAEDRGPGMESYRALVVRMLGELLQDRSPERVADMARSGTPAPVLPPNLSIIHFGLCLVQ
jgi:hypothetical protein